MGNPIADQIVRQKVGLVNRLHNGFAPKSKNTSWRLSPVIRFWFLAISRRIQTCRGIFGMWSGRPAQGDANLST